MNNTETKVSYSAELNKVAIDSLRILLPFDKVENESNLEIISARVNLETGTFTDEEVLTSERRKFPDTEASIQFGIVEPMAGNQKKGEKKYYLKLTAKMLGERYLEGINKDDLTYLWEQTQKIPNFLKFNEETFRNATHTDTDFKIDLKATIEESQALLKEIERITPEENRKYISRYDKKGNIGLEFNNRIKATPRKAFLKWYNKQMELNRPENIWLRNILIKRYGTVPEILRYEFSFKSVNTWKQNGLTKPRTLQELCEYAESKEITEFLINAPDKMYVMKTEKNQRKEQLKTKDQNAIESPIEGIIRIMAEELIQHGRGRNYFLGITEKYMRDNGLTKDDARPRRVQAYINVLLEGMDTPEQKKMLKTSTRVEELLKQFNLL